jgi:metal-dependent HD superfamily phosphatase/phosphodiesterase
MRYEDIIKNEEVRALIRKGNANLQVLGFTDHSEAHTMLVAERAAMILKEFGFSEHEQEMAKIAGFMHDIGNAVNRKNHAEYGGILANDILKEYDLSLEDRITIMSAIGHHDESTGRAMDAISAALIIADKTDVRRNRVTSEKAAFDIHDRVNYAVVGSNLKIDVENKVISLNLQIDETICTMYDYFEIFLGRMMMCRSAADMLDAQFKLKVNGAKVL